MIICFFIIKLLETIIYNLFQTLNCFITSIQNNSQTFYNYIGGIGLLLAGIGGMLALKDWSLGVKENKISKKNRIKNMTIKLKTRYPIEKHKKTFKLIKSIVSPRPVYLLDLNTKTKHWIASYSTFLALGYSPDMIIKLDQKDFDRYKTGENIEIK